MRIQRIEEILGSFPKRRITVIGDFFLDQYWVVEPDLAEVSVETGLTANQVVDVRHFPGAAGTLVNNLAALGVGTVRTVGFVGDDGNGFELSRHLDALGVDRSGLLVSPSRRTPVYTKPMFHDSRGSETEGERFDIKNRSVTPFDLEESIVEEFERAARTTDAVVVLDQVQEEDCGVMTNRVRGVVTDWARNHPESIVLADSRSRISRFENVVLKPNLAEARAAFPDADLEEILERFYRLSGRAVFLTRGAEGIEVWNGEQLWRVPAIPFSGPVDPVGAGDSSSAGIVSALAAGAAWDEAARLGVLTAAVTIRKLGTTGTATPAEILEIARQ